MAKISFDVKCTTDDDTLRRNREHCSRLGLPSLGSKPVALAVVGGGKSALDNVEALRDFAGEVWAINGAFQWCLENDIEATFYSLEAEPVVASDCKGAKRAIVSDAMDPIVFNALQGAEIETVRLGKDGLASHTSTAATAPMVAAERGHTSVTFYGIDLCFEGASHHYKDQPTGKIWVGCGGREFLTNPHLLMQAEFMAELAIALPGSIKVTGDGFLANLITEGGEYDVTHVSPDIHNSITMEAA